MLEACRASGLWRDSDFKSFWENFGKESHHLRYLERGLIRNPFSGSPAFWIVHTCWKSLQGHPFFTCRIASPRI